MTVPVVNNQYVHKLAALRKSRGRRRATGKVTSDLATATYDLRARRLPTGGG